MAKRTGTGTASLPPTLGPHPLMIPHVVERISQHCSYTDLQEVRLVCSQWYSHSLKYFAARSCLHFRNYKELNFFMEETATENIQNTDNPNDDSSPTVLQHSSLIPIVLCSHVRLSGMEFQSLTVLLRPFLVRFSSHLKTFEIDHGNVSHCPSGIEVFLRELASNVRNLETLILYGSHLTYQPQEPVIHFLVKLPTVKKLKVVLRSLTPPRNGCRFFREILRALPNLENITCINYPLLYLLTLEEIELPRGLNTLHLHLRNGIGFQNFIDQKLWIRNLKLNIEVSLSLVNLHLLIQSFCHCLDTLELRFATIEGENVYNYSHNATSFPSAIHLTSLKYLRLVGYWGNLYFLKLLPKLEQVDVECMQWRIAFPEGTENEDLFPVKTRKIVRFFDEKRIYRELCK